VALFFFVNFRQPFELFRVIQNILMKYCMFMKKILLPIRKLLILFRQKDCSKMGAKPYNNDDDQQIYVASEPAAVYGSGNVCVRNANHIVLLSKWHLFN